MDGHVVTTADPSRGSSTASHGLPTFNGVFGLQATEPFSFSFNPPSPSQGNEMGSWRGKD